MRPGCVLVPVCKTLPCIKMCLLRIIQTPKRNIAALPPRAVQLVFINKTAGDQHHLWTSETSAPPQTTCFFQTAAPPPSASTPKRNHSRAGCIPHLEPGSPGLTYQLPTQSPREPLWQNTSCCCWIIATHARPEPASAQPSTGRHRHRGSATAAPQLKPFLGPPDIDTLTVWVVVPISISATGGHSQLSCTYSLGFTRCSSPNVPNFKELQVYKTTPCISKMENTQALCNFSRRLVWGFWMRLACVD